MAVLTTLKEDTLAPMVEQLYSNRFHIAFEQRQSGHGHIEGIEVLIRRCWIPDTSHANIDLCRHPLYPTLERYVLANPTRKMIGHG